MLVSFFGKAMKTNTNHTNGNNNTTIQDITDSEIHIGDKIYNNSTEDIKRLFEDFKEEIQQIIVDLVAKKDDTAKQWAENIINAQKIENFNLHIHLNPIQDKIQEIEQYKQDISRKNKIIDKLLAENETISQEKESLQQDLVKLEQQVADKTISETDYWAQKADLAQQIQAKEELIAQKDKEMGLLIAENLKQSSLINKLQEKLDVAEKALAELQAKYKDIDFSQRTETYKKAYDFILAGNVQAADGLLSEVYFADREAKIAAQTKEIYRNLAQEYVLKAQTLTANFKWEEAENYYEKAIEKCPDAEFWFEYAHFLGKQNYIQDAILYYEKALIQNKQDKDEPKIANTLNNLAALQYKNTQLELAEANFQEALSIRRKLAHANPDVYLPYVADTLNNFGVLQEKKEQFKQAEINFQEALDIRRKLAQANPTTTLPDNF